MRDLCRLTSLVTVTRRFIMQKARRHCNKQLRPLVGAWFQELFHSSQSKCFSPFPHGTGSLSVSQKYLALPDGPGRFAQDFTCPALLRIPLCCNLFQIRGYHPLWPFFPEASFHIMHATSRSYYPAAALPQSRFGLFPVRSPLLRESLFIFSSCRY